MHIVDFQIDAYPISCSPDEHLVNSPSGYPPYGICKPCEGDLRERERERGGGGGGAGRKTDKRERDILIRERQTERQIEAIIFSDFRI